MPMYHQQMGSTSLESLTSLDLLEQFLFHRICFIFKSINNNGGQFSSINLIYNFLMNTVGCDFHQKSPISDSILISRLYLWDSSLARYHGGEINRCLIFGLSANSRIPAEP